jgi:hypothetical protein
METNGHHFEIEKSADESNWINIGSIKAIGNSITMNHYDFTDRLELDAMAYYRIRMIDMDGNESYSGTSIVDRVIRSKPEIVIFPNPSNTSSSVNLKMEGFNWIKGVNVAMYNSLGQQIFEIRDVKENNLRLSCESLVKGLYVIEISNAMEKVTQFLNVN